MGPYMSLCVSMGRYKKVEGPFAPLWILMCPNESL